MIVVTVDKQTGNVVGRPEIITRGFVHGNEHDPLIEEAVRRVIAAIENPGDHISEVALLKSQIKDAVSPLPVRADEAPPDGLPGRGGGLDAWPATRRSDRRAARRAAPPPRRVQLPRSACPSVSPDVARSIVGLVLLVLGAVTADRARRCPARAR